MTEPIARIEAALTHLGEEHEPPLGWEARVLAATARPRHKPWWWFALPIVALAAIALIVVVPRAGSQDFQLVVEIEKSRTIVRGTSAHVGDVVHATVTGGKHERAIWVYRNDHLLMTCPGDPQCRSSGDMMISDVTLNAMGTYKIVALTASSALPAPSGNSDVDLARARDTAGVNVTEKLVIVR
jgi:hypothetical protein